MDIKMNNKTKMIYVSPTVVITRVVLEKGIAMSTVNKVELNPWVEEGPEVADNNSDIYLNF